MAATLPLTATAAPQTRTALLGALAAALLAWGAYVTAGWRQAALALVGVLLGFVLKHADFGFTSAWRRLLVLGDGRGLRAQMLMLAVASVLFFPAVLYGIGGERVYGAHAPVGTSVLVGAFVFGIGMQLANGCASGCLFALGGGSTRMVVVLVFFVAGSVLGAAHAPWWWSLPHLGVISLPHRLGLWPALALQLAVLGAIALASLWWERRKGFVPEPGPRAWRTLRGPWPLWAGALALAFLNFATLWLAHRPWGITGAFALWGAWVLDALGVAVREWPYFRAYGPAFDMPFFADVTSVMNVGIVVGALVAAALAGTFRPLQRLSLRELLAAALAGILLGYGARLAFGCNIGAFFSGAASGSLHGWLWMVAALAGSWVGTRLRPLCGLSRV
ncbi:hypothetical protein HRbin39_00017 [bacterium HR39]|nr:hypothetical protein HRbin39_00017 [bacterium HR39]